MKTTLISDQISKSIKKLLKIQIANFFFCKLWDLNSQKIPPHIFQVHNLSPSDLSACASQ